MMTNDDDDNDDDYNFDVKANGESRVVVIQPIPFQPVLHI